MKGFMDFIREQGVVGIAAGFILGGAISKLVEGFVAGIVDPLVASLFNTGNLAQKYTVIGEGANSAQLSWGYVVVLAVNFLVIATVVYYGAKGLGLIKTDKKAKTKKKSKK